MKEQMKNYEIAIYDDEGTLCESISGEMDCDEVRARMLEALRNDGIPVVRKLVQVEATEEKVCGETGETQRSNREWEQPMIIIYEKDGMRFSATGRYMDVMDALGVISDMRNE